MNILANIIAFLHLLFILFVTSTPFLTENPFVLLYYCFILFFVMIHWALNNDTCVLTLIESKLRGKKDNETFMGRLVKPIYNISSNEIKYLSMVLLLYAFLKIRIWEKERYEYIYDTLYDKYQLIVNRLYNNSNNQKNVSENILNNSFDINENNDIKFIKIKKDTKIEESFNNKKVSRKNKKESSIPKNNISKSEKKLDEIIEDNNISKSEKKADEIIEDNNVSKSEKKSDEIIENNIELEPTSNKK
jgi:hypothetical protein